MMTEMAALGCVAPGYAGWGGGGWGNDLGADGSSDGQGLWLGVV